MLSMRSRNALICLFTISACFFCLSVSQAQEKGGNSEAKQSEESGVEADDASIEIVYEFHLNEGSILIGSLEDTAFPVAADFGKVALDFLKMRQVELVGGGDFRCFMSNTDQVTGTPERTSFLVKTLLGPVDVKLELVERIKVVRKQKMSENLNSLLEELKF